MCVSIHLQHSGLLIPVVRQKTLNPFTALFCSTSAFRDGNDLSFFNFYFYSPPPPLTHTHWQLPGFRGVKACIIFHQLSVRYRQKRLLWNSLTACSLAWTSLMSDCSLFLAWTRRSGDGFARQMQLCVCEGVKLHKKADWMEKVSIMRTSNQSKTKAHMKKVLGLLWLVWVVRLVSWQGVSVSVHVNFSGRQL